MPFGAEHWRMDDGTIRQRGVLALVKFGKVALEGPAQSGQLSLETFVPEAEQFINGQCLMGTKKYHEGGIQKQPSRQEELRSDECAEIFAPYPPTLDVGLGDSLDLLATECADPESAPEDLGTRRAACWPAGVGLRWLGSRPGDASPKKHPSRP